MGAKGDQKLLKRVPKTRPSKRQETIRKIEQKWSPIGPNIRKNWSKLDLKWTWNGFGIHSESAGNQFGTHTKFVWN